MSMIDDPGIISEAPRLAELIGSGPATPLDADRARGVLLGLAVGNLLGLPVEGASESAIRDAYPNGVSELDPRERHRPMDDDLAQAVDLAEALAYDPDPVDGFADRLVQWRSENGRASGS